MLSIISIKLLIALVIFLCGLVSTILPLFIVSTNETAFAVGNMLASGVLLAAGLTHQLPDSSSSLDSEDGYPWSFLICGLTFILFLIFEETAHLLFGGHSHDERGQELVEAFAFDNKRVSQRSCRRSITLKVSETFRQPEIADYGGITNGHSHAHRRDDERESLCMKKEPSDRFPSWISNSIVFGDPNRASVVGSHHHHDDHIAEHLHGSFLASLMLLSALSAHSILAGLSIGLVPDVDMILSTAIAIIAHKVFAGYALGSTMVAADLGWDRHMPLGIAFSLSTPVGIFIGMGLASDSYDEDSAPVGIVQAIVAGTFLYVAIIEVGMKELLICRQDPEATSGIISLSEKQAEAIKLFSMLIGFLGMSALAAYV